MASDTDRLLPKQFGPLQGVRILSTGTLIAQPFAANIAAEMGAEVIQIEIPKTGDLVWRQLEFIMDDADGGLPPPVGSRPAATASMQPWTWPPPRAKRYSWT